MIQMNASQRLPETALPVTRVAAAAAPAAAESDLANVVSTPEAALVAAQLHQSLEKSPQLDRTLGQLLSLLA